MMGGKCPVDLFGGLRVPSVAAVIFPVVVAHVGVHSCLGPLGSLIRVARQNVVHRNSPEADQDITGS